MNHPEATLLLAVGVCLGSAMLHLFIGLRRQGSSQVNLTFALFSLTYAGAILCSVYQSDGVGGTQAEVLSNIYGLFAVSVFLFLLWYVALYTEVRPHQFLVFVTMLLCALGIGRIVIGQIRPGAASAGSSLGVWFSVFLVAQLLVAGFALYAAYQHFVGEKRQAALLLGLSMLVFVGSLVATLLTTGVAQSSIYVHGFAFLPLIIAMSLQMSSEVIETEEELDYYRQRLERLVEQRTAELVRTNEALSHEVAEQQRTRRALQQRLNELNVLHQVSTTLSDARSPSTALINVSQFIVRLFNVRYTHIMFKSDGAPTMQLIGFDRETGPLHPTCFEEFDDVGELMRVMSDRRSVIIERLLERQWAPDVDAYLRERNIQSAMLTPLLRRGAIEGILVLAIDEEARTLSTDEKALAKTIAGDVAVFIENMRLVEQSQTAAAAEERSRIARELHDSVTQTMYSVSIVADALPRVLERDPAAGRRNVLYLRQMTVGALAEMRTLLFELRPAALASASLGVLLHQLGDVLTGRNHIPVVLRVDSDVELEPDVKVALYRIAQEALNNVAKHAHPDTVTVTLRRDTGCVELHICDDGRGFDSTDLAAEQMGMAIMRERAQAAGAQIEIESAVGRGTRVFVSWQEVPESEKERVF